MTRDEIATRARQIVAEHLKVPLDQVTEDATFDALGADSLDHIEIGFDLEQAFDIEVSDEDAEQLKTFGNAVDFLERKLGVGAAVAA